MNSPLQRAQRLLNDPRPPQQWTTQPGQATELLAVLRDVTSELVTADDHIQLAAGSIQDLLNTVRSQRTELDGLAESCANVLKLHQRSFDGSCSSCRIPHPCHTSRAVTDRTRP